jgi:glutathione S-transferase
MNASSPALVLCELNDSGIPGLESFSPFCLKVHRALKLAGLPYTRRHGAMPRDFRAHSPTGQVPVLLVGDEAVCDSTRIVERIDALSGGALSARLDPAARAEAWLWEEMADGSLAGFLVASRWADDRNWPLVHDAFFGGAPWLVRALIAPRVRARIVGGLVARDVWRAGADACWSRFLATLNHLDARAPAIGFWLGAAPSIADVAIFAQLHSMRTHLTRFQADQIALRGRLASYLDRVDAATAERPAASLTPAAPTPALRTARAPIAGRAAAHVS